MSGQMDTATALPPGKEHLVRTYLIGFVGPKVGLDVVAKRKIPVPVENRTPAAEHAVSHYID